MSDIYFQGFWRMDWSLGNPNKTAALIAMLMVAVWMATRLPKGGFWIAQVPFTALGICLIHTFSRGGLVAALVGLAFILIRARWPWPMARVVALGISISLMIAATLYLGAEQRYSQGVMEKDPSIANRMEIWKMSPAMMADAPGGCGWGKAGDAFVQWYQPVNRMENYRTLVNSHLTWMVEGGWPWRFAYLFAWLAVFAICWPMKDANWMAIPCGVWLTFVVAAFFSSVAESPWLWILPLIGLIACLLYRLAHNIWPARWVWMRAAGYAMAACVILWFVGSLESHSLRGSSEMVTLRSGSPKVWLITDMQTLGSDYGRSLRRSLHGGKEAPSLGIVKSIMDLPPAIRDTQLIVAGARSPEELKRLGDLIDQLQAVVLLAPAFYPKDLPFSDQQGQKVKVVFGEFSQSPTSSDWVKTGRVQMIPGSGDYLPGWPSMILADEK